MRAASARHDEGQAGRHGQKPVTADPGESGEVVFPKKRKGALCGSRGGRVDFGGEYDIRGGRESNVEEEERNATTQTQKEAQIRLGVPLSERGTQSHGFDARAQAPQPRARAQGRAMED